MTRAWVVALLVAGCASAPRETSPTPRREPSSPAPAPAPAPAVVELPPLETPPKDELLTFPRPELPAAVRSRLIPPAVDTSDYLRWPLTAGAHPVLEPAYPIARVFAQPGVAWHELCERGAQNRRTPGIPADQSEYLRAWCEVARHEPEAAVARLASLQRSSVTALAGAVQRDLANIVVDSGDAALAQRLLSNAHAQDPAIYDLVSASYAELGKTEDAIEFNELALATFARPRPGDQCHRLAKRVLFAVDPGDRKSRFALLERASTDESCARMTNELQCSTGGSCAGYMADHGLDPNSERLLHVYLGWPEHGASAAFWYSLAVSVADMASAPGGDVLATSALEAAMISNGCEGSRIHTIRANAHEVQQKTRDAKLLARLATLVEHPEKLCPP